MLENYTAIIPARKGSVRLKNKNTKLLNGKPLIEYSIDFALQFNFKKIIITSNDEKVEKIVNNYKNTQIYFYKRDEKLSYRLLQHPLKYQFHYIFSLII